MSCPALCGLVLLNRVQTGTLPCSRYCLRSLCVSPGLELALFNIKPSAVSAKTSQRKSSKSSLWTYIWFLQVFLQLSLAAKKPSFKSKLSLTPHLHDDLMLEVSLSESSSLSFLSVEPFSGVVSVERLMSAMSKSETSLSSIVECASNPLLRSCNFS